MKSSTAISLVIVTLLIMSFTSTVSADDNNNNIRFAKDFIVGYGVDDLSDFVFLENALEIPYQKGDFKNPVSYAEKVQPPSVNRMDNAFVVTLYTWCEEEGILIGWQVKIKDDKITSMIGEVVDTGIGHFKPRTEGVVHVPGYRISVEFDRASLIKSMSPADPGEIQVSDPWVEIRPLSADTESTTISVSGFGANEVVDISITVGTHNIQDASGNPIQINTNGDGDGSTVFKPAQNSYSGRAEIEATSPSDHAVLEFGSFTDEGRCLTLEEIIIDTATVNGNTVTFEVHYTDQAVDSVATQHKITPQSLLNAVTNAYQVQCGDWGFNRHLGTDYDADGVFHLYENDGQYDFHGNHGTNAYSGSERRINYQANLDYAFTNQGIDYAGENVIVGHEHFHGIQCAYNNGQFKWDPYDAYVEGTARFTQTIMDANAEHKSNSLFSLDANDYMSNTDRRLRDFSYNYCLYWGFLYQHNGGMATLEEIMEEIRSVGNNIETDLPQAITNVLSRVPGDHDTFEESVEDFSVSVYEKDFNWNSKDWGTLLNDVHITSTIDFKGGQDDTSGSVNEWAADYIKVDLTNIGTLKVEFDGYALSDFFVHAIPAEPGAYEVVEIPLDWLEDGKYRETDAKQLDNVTMIITGADWLLGDGTYTLKTTGISRLNILKPTQTAPVNVGPHDDPTKTTIEFEIKRSDGVFMPELTKERFKDFKDNLAVKIGGKSANILAVTEKANKYVVEVTPPKQDMDGKYDLNVSIDSVYDLETESSNYGAKGVDMALIIDSSGSMEWNDPGDFRKTAAKQFVALANIGDQICVADFGHSGCDSRLLLQLLGITDESSRNTMNAAIDQVVSYGSTPIGYGLQRGYNELSSSRAVAGHNKAGILLTDGDDTCNTEGTARTYASSFKSNGWSLYTIALTGAADEAFLNELASLGNGEYAGKAPTSEELHEIYRIISGRVLGEQTTTTVEGTAQQSQTSIETALIDSSVTSAKFVISWPGSDLDLTLERPDGGIIDPDVAAADPGIDYTSAASYEFYAVDSPMAGEWKLKIFGVDVPAEGEDYTGSVMAVTDVTMNMYLDRDEYATGEPIKVSVSISDATQPITNATVIADVELPMATTSSSTNALAGKDYATEEEKSELASLRVSLQTASSSLHDQITLFDDGMHGDGIANDGVYANFYTNASVEGTYKFTAKASGTTNTGEEFTRVAEQSTYVTGAATPEISITPTTWSFEFEHGISVKKNFTMVSSVDTIASMTATDLTDEFGNVIPSTNISFYPSVLSLSANEPQNFTADITIPQNSHAGNYSGSIIITAPECTLNVEVTITYQLIRSAEFSGVYTDYGDDTNGDGLYDYLTIEVGVDVGETGYYLVEGILYDCYSDSVGWASNHTYLNAGSQMVQLDFNGINIRQNGVNGTYDLKFLYLYDSNWNQSDYIDDAYTTYYYNYTDFQTPPAEFNGVYTDYGDDSDGDGLYDYLTIEIGVYVRETGYYQVNGELHDCYGGYVGKISNYIYLNAGNQTVQFNFSGIKIRWNGVDGTYDLKYLRLYGDNWNQYIYDAYTTSYYHYTDFQTVPSCYNYTDEYIVYAWDAIDTPDQSWTGCDDCSYNYVLPWNFTFFCEDHSSIQISTNGLITFPPDTSNHCCSPDFENTEAIAPFWSDLSQACGQGTNISVQDKGDRVVVVWYTGTYGEGCLNKDLFEAILYENGKIRFNYNYLNNIPHNVGAGIGNGIVYYTNTWDNGTSVVYSPANGTPPTATISIADANAQSGYSTTTQITINNMTNFGAATVALSYDPDVVQITDITAGDVGTPIANINNTTGTATIAAYITTATGPDSPITFANLELLAVGNNGETSPLTLIITTLTDADGASISATPISGIFTVSGLRGDANNDGNVDVVDAMFVAQYAVGNRDASTLNMANADANLDGNVDVVDAMFIAQYAVGARTW